MIRIDFIFQLSFTALFAVLCLGALIGAIFFDAPWQYAVAAVSLLISLLLFTDNTYGESLYGYLKKK